MIIHDIADYLMNLTCKDIKPDIYSVFDSPCENNCPNNVNSEKLTILEILNAIGRRLKNLFGFVKINTTTETIDEDEAVVNVSGDVDNLNFDFKIPSGKTGPQGPTGPGVAAGGTTGQVLAKKSDANYDTEWINNSGGEIPGTFTIPITETEGKITTSYNYQSVIDAVNNGKVPYLLNTATGEIYMLLNYNGNPTATSRWFCPQYNFAGTAAKIVHFITWNQISATSKFLTKTTTYFQTIPTGGTTGQVLVKKSNDDFDVKWTTI